MFDWHNVFSPGHSKLAPNNGRAQGNALLGILMRSWAGNMKPDVAMKLINTKYRTPSPHQFFASGRFDVIAADVSFRDIKRRGEWNEGGGREREEGRMCARARVQRSGSRGPPFIPRSIYEGAVYRPIQKQFSVRLSWSFPLEISIIPLSKWIKTECVISQERDLFHGW